MRLVVAGTPEVAVPALNALAASSHQGVAGLTRPDAQSGRGRRIQRSAVAAWADQHGVPVLQPARLGEPPFLEMLAGLAPDCCPVIAYGALIPRAALSVPRLGWINLHFSLLPAWRGAAPVQHAIIAGDDITGASTFLIEEGLDTGPVYGTLTEPIHPGDTAGTLLARLATAGASLLTATMDGVEQGALVPVPQPGDGVSLAPKVTVEMAELDWRAPAQAIDRLIRGCTPAPGAWTWFRGERLGLGPVRVDRALLGSLDSPAQQPQQPQQPRQPDRLAPGELRARKRAVLAGTADAPVELGLARPPGKREMPAADWARGVRLAAGERLGVPVIAR